MPPLLFDGKHWGNDPIWTPPQHLQQQTPVVSANIDGPPVIPKQIPKKIPKTVHTTTPPPQTAANTATPMPVSIPPPNPELILPTTIVEQIDDGMCVDMQDDGVQYIEIESPVQIIAEQPTLETDIDEITDEIEQMSVMTTEFVNNTNEIIGDNQIEVEESQIEDEGQNDEPEEVITEFIDTEQQSTMLSSMIIESVDDDKEMTLKHETANLLGPIDETDRVLPAISHRSEHVRNEFERVMEKYGGQLANTAILPPGLVIKDTVDNNGTIVVVPVAVAAATNSTVTDQKPQENQEPSPESEDDDADKENNIQNKKYLQEVSTNICMASTYTCVYTACMLRLMYRTSVNDL